MSLNKTSMSNMEKMIKAECETCTGGIMKLFHQRGIKDQYNPISTNLLLYLLCSVMKNQSLTTESCPQQHKTVKFGEQKQNT